jgi:hypothetical protein
MERVWYLRLVLAIDIALTVAQVVAFACLVGSLDLPGDGVDRVFKGTCGLRWSGALLHVWWSFDEIHVALLPEGERSIARSVMNESAVALSCAAITGSFVLQAVLLFCLVDSPAVLFNPAVLLSMADLYFSGILGICYGAFWLVMSFPGRFAGMRASVYRFCCADPPAIAAPEAQPAPGTARRAHHAPSAPLLASAAAPAGCDPPAYEAPVSIVVAA